MFAKEKKDTSVQLRRKETEEERKKINTGTQMRNSGKGEIVERCRHLRPGEPARKGGRNSPKKLTKKKDKSLEYEGKSTLKKCRRKEKKAEPTTFVQRQTRR